MLRQNGRFLKWMKHESKNSLDTVSEGSTVILKNGDRLHYHGTCIDKEYGTPYHVYHNSSGELFEDHAENVDWYGDVDRVIDSGWKL